MGPRTWPKAQPTSGLGWVGLGLSWALMKSSHGLDIGRRETARATGHNASSTEFCFARPSTISNLSIAHVTGIGAPSVTYKLEELLPPLSPGPAPLEFEDSYIPIDEPLELNSFEPVTSPEPESEPSVRPSLPTRSERPYDNQSNLEIPAPILPISEPREDICTLARALADQLYQHHGCCHKCHEQAHTAHQETHSVHTGLGDYVDQINIDGDFPDVLSSTTIAVRESNLVQQIPKVRKQQIYCRTDSRDSDRFSIHLYVAADYRPNPSLGITVDIDSVGGFTSNLAVARRGIR
ncbi:uncharacterized protein KD926_005343 [Aspergillus affinis]|uniref:uncharacterized protein n=1 Tax=Aspergillus affinis TaxID=1070780 RepID=UPI0022FEE997|nr:uncharacterized protein KD926_005343 [Aspergillus affinis]KAI9034823.1 hypothetical protein KD926_005343 [Aspergillus affinis]